MNLGLHNLIARGIFQFPLMPEQASEGAARYDRLFLTITGLTILFTVIVCAMVVILAVRYRRSAKIDRSNPMTHSTILEAIWLGVPLVLGLVIFVWSATNFIKVRTMPKEGKEIFAMGKQWMWHFEHLDGIRENNELHVPVGVPIKMTMISQDVIHSMYLPAMRAQYHVVPGRYTQLHFTPTKTGEFLILCAMHCGTQHSEMVGKLIVLSETDYQKWQDNGGNRFRPSPKTMEEAGRLTFNEQGCANCHTGVDNPRAPTMLGLMGSKRTFTDGSSATADADYIRESILNPERKITAGWENIMQSYHEQLTEEEVMHLVKYIQSLSGVKGDYEKSEFPSEPQATRKLNTTDSANREQSAGAAQFQQTPNSK